MVKNYYRSLLSMILVIVVVMSSILPSAYVLATENIDLSKSGEASLTLQLPAVSDSVRLYQIAEYDSESKITMIKEAEDLNITIDSNDNAATLSEKAEILAAEISSMPTVGATDEMGIVRFDELTLGYYLVVVDKCESDSAKYEIAPMIVSVPAVQLSSMKYDVSVKLKGQEVKTTPVPATTIPKATASSESGETVGSGDILTPDISDVTVQTLTETPSPTPMEIETPSPTPIETAIPTDTVTLSPTPTETEIPSPTPTETEIPSTTPIPTEMPSLTPTEPVFSPDDSSISDVTVTPDPNMWQMSVTKYWINKNNLPLPENDETIPESLSIQIWKKASNDAKWQKVELVDLTAENKWTYSWMAPDDGATWTVTEDVTPIDFTQMTIKQTMNTVKKTLDFKVTNMSNAYATPTPIQLSVVKYWKDKSGNDLDDKEIKVESLPIQIYRREKDTETWKLYKKVDLTADTAWEYHWGAADDGASWTVTERDVPEGYVLQTPIRLGHNATNTKLEFRVTNVSTDGATPTPTDTPPPTPTKTPTLTPTQRPFTPTPTPTPVTISFSVVKKWQTASGGTLSNSMIGVSSVTVDIYRKYPGVASYTKVDSVELLPTNNWAYSWTAQDDGSTWTVTEPRIPSGYTKVGITLTKNDNTHTRLFTITNKKTSSVTVTPTRIPTPTPSPSTKRFSDVQDPSHPYYKAIYWAVDAGITKGYDDGTFGINKSCTRGEMVMFLWRFVRKPAPSSVSKSPFPDVPKYHTFYKAVLWAYQKGITKGYSDGTFGVDRKVTRGESMMFLWRIKGKPAPKSVAKSPFKDVSKTHAFYKAILWGSQEGITKGYTTGEKKGTFGINDNCIRGQIVTFLYRAR